MIKLNSPAPTQQPIQPTAPTPQPVATTPEINQNSGSGDVGAQDFSQGNTTNTDSSSEIQPSDDASLDQSQDQPVDGDMFKNIQKITGKLAQRMREGAGELTTKQIKYVLNSIVSAIDINKIDPNDKLSIINKLQGKEEQEAPGGGGNPANGANPNELAEDDIVGQEEPENENYGILKAPIVQEVIKLAGLESSVQENPGILAFDIAEAMYVYIHDYNDSSSYIAYLKGLLQKNNFKSRPSLSSYNNLDPDGKEFYMALIKHGESNPSINEDKKTLYNFMINEIKSKLKNKV